MKLTPPAVADMLLRPLTKNYSTNKPPQIITEVPIALTDSARGTIGFSTRGALSPTDVAAGVLRPGVASAVLAPIARHAEGTSVSGSSGYVPNPQFEARHCPLARCPDVKTHYPAGLFLSSDSPARASRSTFAVNIPSATKVRTSKWIANSFLVRWRGVAARQGSSRFTTFAKPMRICSRTPSTTAFAKPRGK